MLTCESCRVELAGFRETVARLAAVDAMWMLWPALLRVEVWRLGIVDEPAATRMAPPIARMVEDGGTLNKATMESDDGSVGGAEP